MPKLGSERDTGDGDMRPVGASRGRSGRMGGEEQRCGWIGGGEAAVATAGAGNVTSRVSASVCLLVC